MFFASYGSRSSAQSLHFVFYDMAVCRSCMPRVQRFVIARFVSDLVRNPEDRISCDAAPLYRNKCAPLLFVA